MNYDRRSVSQQLVTHRANDYNYNTMERADSETALVQQPRPAAERRTLSCWNILARVLSGIVVLVMIIYISIPLLIHSSSTVRRNVLFVGFLTSANHLSDPEEFGLNCSRNFFITSDQPGIRLGTWYMQTSSLPCKIDTVWYPGDDVKVVLYLHGITKTRSSLNRVELMKKLSWGSKTHVIAIDYRGFGDSTNVTPSLQGVVADALAVYKYLNKIISNDRIVIWGHSLGTSVAMYLSAELNKLLLNPAAIILESAFDDIGSVAKYNKLAKPYKWLPCFEKLLVDPFMADPTTAFNTTAQIQFLNPLVPMLMLHAQDDQTVPFNHGLALYNNILDARGGNSAAAAVTFIPFNASHTYGHSLIPFYPDLSGIVTRFLSDLRIPQSSSIEPVL